MPEYTEKQGQYLAFIYYYTLVNGLPPAEADMARFFRVSPPSAHQMVLKLEERGFIAREAGKGRTTQVLLPFEQLPRLEEPSVPGRAKKAAPAPSQIYQIKVALEDSHPPIWRRILAPDNITLAKLHLILQVVMGWTDSHLHQFIVGDAYFGVPDSDYDFEMHDERRVKLAQIVPGEGYKLRYEYDFGDGWMHTLLVEKILPPRPGQPVPACIKGKRACPPEDVGGIWGYYGFLEAIQNPNHPEHDDYLEWVGGEFDPEAFDLDEVNATLRRLG